VTGDLTEKWTSQGGLGNSISAGNGRRGTSSMRCTGNSTYTALSLTNQAIWVVGFALRYGNVPVNGAAGIVNWVDASTIQTELRIETSGRLGVYRGTTKLGETTLVVPTNTFTYIEWYVKHDQTSGEMRVAVNGVLDLTLTSQDTTNTANAFASIMRIGNHGTNSGFNMGNQDFDDLYICDGAGATHTTLLGDCRVDALLPNGDGSNSAWTVSTGTTHSTLVDDAAPNDDTDYLSTATASARESHAVTNLPSMATPLIYGLQHCLSMKKDDAGTRQVKSLLKSGATTQAGATTHTLSTSYVYYRELWTLDPATGAAWDVAAVNALEAGAEAQ
jgi:hypothetical protein